MTISQAKALLDASDSIVVLTGAGISAESGIPTFRGPGGLWRSRRPEDLATPEAFESDPRLVWEWYDWRRGLIGPAAPNLGHYALVTLEKRTAELTLVTQNVDGLHARAGSRNLLEIHGNVWRTRCLECREVRDDHRVPLPEIPPRCPCGGLLRPDVVWFGEPLPYETLKRAFRAIEGSDVMLVIGTSGVVQPAASMGAMALERGARVIEVNPEPTPMSGRYTHYLQGAAGEILPRLVTGDRGML